MINHFYILFLDLGDGWGATVIECEEEFEFIQQSLINDQDLDHFVDGSYSSEAFYFGQALGFQTYSPRQTGYIWFLNVNDSVIIIFCCIITSFNITVFIVNTFKEHVHWYLKPVYKTTDTFVILFIRSFQEDHYIWFGELLQMQPLLRK